MHDAFQCLDFEIPLGYVQPRFFFFCEIKANRPQLLGHALPSGDVLPVNH